MARERRRLADEPFRLLGGAGRSAQRRCRSRVSRRRARRCRACPRRSPIRRACSCAGAALRSRCGPGYALYGGNPTPGAPNPMRPVVTLDVAIQQTRWIEAGETCGYNGQWTAQPPHAAGDPARRLRRRPAARRRARSTGARGPRSSIAGRRCPLVGRVSMDLLHRRRHRPARERGAAGRDSRSFFGAAIGARRIRRRARARSATRPDRLGPALRAAGHRRLNRRGGWKFAAPQPK